jgi:transposase
MKGYTKRLIEGKDVFVGVDLHQRSWHITVRTDEDEVFSGSVPGKWEALRDSLLRFKDHAGKIKVVYEAGYFGFWLHDRLVGWGCECIVTPPSLLPQESGNRVKTDKRDSAKLALMLAKGMLKAVWIPSVTERYHRQVTRRRRQLVEDRVRTQNRIKAELRCFGIAFAETKGKWSREFVSQLRRIRSDDRFMKQSFGCLLDELEFLNGQIKKQTLLLKELSETDPYKERVKILKSAPGIGLISAMEILLELCDVARFRRGSELAAYVGLTPSQYSSGDKVRMGRITRVGKSNLRGVLVECSWMLIAKDPAMREKYETLKARCGGKRAIVAIARIFLLRLRRMLLDGNPYAMGLVVS